MPSSMRMASSMTNQAPPVEKDTHWRNLVIKGRTRLATMAGHILACRKCAASRIRRAAQEQDQTHLLPPIRTTVGASSIAGGNRSSPEKHHWGRRKLRRDSL